MVGPLAGATAVRLADALDYEHGGRRLVELAGRELLTAEEVANLEEPLESLVGSECETLTSCG